MTLNEIDADLIEPHRLAQCVVDQLKVENRRPTRTVNRGLSAREALSALAYEAQLVAVCAENQALGIPLTDDDRSRLLVSWGLIDTIYTEVVR